MYETIIGRAIQKIGSTVYGKFLLEQFPVHIVSATAYPEEYAVLKKYGSPAATDGKSIFISPEVTGEFFNKHEFKEWDMSAITWSTELEQFWRLLKTKEEKHVYTPQEIQEDVVDILLHEFTHAVNEHPKLQRAARDKSDEYQKRLQVACEIQANDGLMGHTYERNYAQQPEGVTNKRQHPETIGCHTLSAIMQRLELNNDERTQMMMQSAGQSGKAQQEMMEATGEAQRVDREIEMERKERKEEQNNNEHRNGGGPGGEDIDHKTTDDKLAHELAKVGMDNVKQLVLAALTDELKYDPTTESVVLNKVVRKTVKKTYSRINRRSMSNTATGMTVLRKGAKREKLTEYNKANDLLVIAVDSSGSMSNMEQYVGAVLNDLLRQVGEMAKKHGIDVKWENLQGMEHTNQATRMYPVTSDEWKRMMDNYYADGGNDFDCVLRRVNDDKLEDHVYDSVTIINLSDGLDEMNSDFSGMPVHDYIKDGRLKWVDALIADTHDIARASWCATRDFYKGLRKQVVLHVKEF